MEYIERVELQFWQAGQVCPHLLFLLGRGPRKNACWGAPQTRRTSGQSVQKSLLSAAPALPLLGLVPPVRMAEQIVDTALDRHGLPHIHLGFAVLGIEGLFLVCQLPPPLF